MQKNKDVSTEKISEFVPYIVIIFAALAVMLWITRGGRMLYGALGDWSEQHTAIPELLRREFYKTGKLIPDFIYSAGGGQNAFYFAYYGILSPWVLLSYLFPFLGMRTYLIIAAVCAQIVSACLIYQWLRRSYRIMPALTAALLFCLAAGFSHHVHYHIMFVLYMPFFIMALRSFEGQIERGRSAAGFIIWMSLAVFCCYFFAVAEFIAAGVFAIFLGLRQTESDHGGRVIKGVISAVFKLILDAVVVVMITSVLWLPSIYTLLGRSGGHRTVSFSSLMIPVFHGEYMMYEVDSFGATALLVVVLAYMLIKIGRSWKWLGAVFLIVSFFALPIYVMNGGMYIHGKVLFPFLPMMSLMEAQFLDDALSRKVPWKKLLCAAIPMTVIFFVTFGSDKRWIFLKDSCFTAIVLLIALYGPAKKYREILISLLIIPALLVSCDLKNTGKLAPAGWGDDLPEFSQISGEYRTGYYMGKHTPVNLPITDRENLATIYSSVSNWNYNVYYHKLSGNEIRFRNSATLCQPYNPYFNAQMGVHYIITDGKKKHEPELNYKLIDKQGKYCLYENKDVLPVIYTAGSEPDLNDEKRKPLKVPGLGTSFNVSTNGTERKTLYINPSDHDRIIRVSFKMINHNKRYRKWFGIWERRGMLRDHRGDVRILVDNVMNARTSPNAIYDNWNKVFSYSIYFPAHETRLRWELRHGDYELDNIKLTEVPANTLVKKVKSVQPLNFDTKRSKGNVIIADGSLSNGQDIFTSIPYDKGFSAAVDGKPVSVQKTKLGFLSLSGDWNTGKHRIVITYQAPGKRTGMIISLAGLIMLAGIVLFRRKKRVQ
ncbi:MAG: hypothetical protein DUD27_03780 [Lachnospiraceae bacterium]|nr:MAG: hypothetical protein DUD27_03780 [Lachnospiraceae bacterium]